MKTAAALLTLAAATAAYGQGLPFPGAAALAGTAGTNGIVFSPTGGTTGATQYVGLSYPTVPADNIFFTLGPLCPVSGNCPVGDSVISGASTAYTGPKCIPTTTCTSGSNGFGTAIAAHVNTTINAQVYQGFSINQNNLSKTALPANWFPVHWKYIIANCKTAGTSGQKCFGVTPVIVTTPTASTGCGISGFGETCVGNVMTGSPSSPLTYCGSVPTVPPGTSANCGVSFVNVTGSVFVVPNAPTPQATAPIDPSTGAPAAVTHLGFNTSTFQQAGGGRPQVLYTETNESSQDCASTFCTWMTQDYWILADGSVVAAYESDMQIWDSVGEWTFALQCRLHGSFGITSGWGYGQQTGNLLQVPGTTSANCPSATQWLHVIYTGTRTQNVSNPAAGTFTIVSLTLQSAPGGPAGSTGYAVFPINHTFTVDSAGTGNSCTNQFQIDGWSSGINGAYYALNNVTCGTGTPPVTPVATQLYN